MTYHIIFSFIFNLGHMGINLWNSSIPTAIHNTTTTNTFSDSSLTRTIAVATFFICALNFGSGTFIDNLNKWKKNRICEFVKLDSKQEEIQIGQLFELEFL